MPWRDNLWWGTSGPPQAPIVLVGEAWGAEEARAERPFVGASGIELDRMLAEAGLQRGDILCLNVVSARPQNNEMWRYFNAHSETPAAQRLRGLAPTPFVLDQLRRLYNQLSAVPRRLIIASGNYALWALSDVSGISTGSTEGRKEPTGIQTWRGSMLYSRPHPLDEPGGLDNVPLLPIIHPAAILRQWSQRAVTVHDLKTRVPQALTSDWRGPSPLFCPPSFSLLVDQLKDWLSTLDREPLSLAVDIETARGFITCLGIADSNTRGCSIPFIRRPEGADHFASWWSTHEEVEITRLLCRLLVHPNVEIIGQNFIYDTQYIQHWLGVTPRLSFDTMLAQNVMFPGTPKDLSYLSSLYCRYHWHWKEDHKEWDMKGRVEDLLTYNCWDVVRTYEIAESQREVLRQLKLEPQMKLKMEVNRLCLRMMNRGVRFDTARRQKVSLELHEALTKLQQELLRIIPQEFVDPDYPSSYERAMKRKAQKYVFWYSSDKQTKFVLYELLGLPVVIDRKTKRPTSGKEARNELSRKFPEWSGLFTRLGLAESVDNSYHVVNSGIDPDGRIRCSFNPGGTETHRLSSSKNAFGRGANLQNITSGKEDD